MTFEDRLQQMLGAKDFQIAALATQLEQANKKIEEQNKEIKELTPPERGTN